jgi:hypothetical protein
LLPDLADTFILNLKLLSLTLVNLTLLGAYRVLDFEGTIENAKNVARYAKGVVGATGVILTKK